MSQQHSTSGNNIIEMERNEQEAIDDRIVLQIQESTTTSSCNPDDSTKCNEQCSTTSLQQQPDEPPDETATTTTTKKRRIICSRCDRPLCICLALPLQPIHLQHCHIIVLQHPHEKKMKNASLPIIQLCFNSDSLTVVVSRRFGNPPSNETLSDIIDRKISQIQSKQSNSSNPKIPPTVWLVYPSDEATSLSHAVEDLIRKNNGTKHSTSDTNNEESNSVDNSKDSSIPFIFVIFLDATWKYSKEMDRANQQFNQYPLQMQRVKLDQSTFDNSTNFIARRFEMFRTPISDYHLSTAECIARVVSSIESSILSSQQQNIKPITNDDDNTIKTDETVETIFDQVMKPLDLMVQQSKSFLQGSEKKHRKSTQQQSKIE